ncbi:MAG: hybrid sensor histidine kinase/response regulator [Gammaproteobacteria bacterium]|nr:MAG: hybrid sensor histidine kinase/response regulator [Gammaproteobacteria bacterium]
MSESQITVLAIDDDDYIRQSYLDCLEDFEYNVFTAENGRVGLDIYEAKKDQIDIIIVDLRMPEVDGFQVVAYVTKSNPQLPIIVVSGNGVIKEAVQALHQGAWDYILKPIEDFNVLIHAVDKCLEKARLIKENKQYQENLEAMVEERTNELNQANEELTKHKHHLQELVDDRTSELNESLEKLNKTKDYLIQSEKMAALGGLVAGVAHEINTPVGIGVTAASHLTGETNKFLKSYHDGGLTRSEMDAYLKTVTDSADMILSNMNRAADLIHSFKQVAVDQSSDSLREFNVKEYLQEIFSSLNPKFKNTNIELHIECADDLQVYSYPGAISQIITNLAINSLVHGFEGKEHGEIIASVLLDGDNLKIIYSDTGVGIPQEHINKIFDPFFTTKRGLGGSGLGLHIVFNIVMQTLNGSIDCHSQPDKGTTFTIAFPCTEHPFRHE